MSERVRGIYKETDFKKYGPEDAGKKVGWSTVLPNTDGDTYYVLGAYATVGEQGGVVATALDTETGKVTWHDHLVSGLSRACSYAILVIPGEDTRLRNTDVIRFDESNAQDLSGHTFHREYDVTDDTVQWAIGEEGLLGALRGSLEEHDIEKEYERIYLTVNGSIGHRMYQPGIAPSPFEVAANQLYDPSMADTAREEVGRFTMYGAVLGERIRSNDTVHAKATAGTLSPDEFAVSREVARGTYLRTNELADAMIAPVLAYTPEGYSRTWPYMDASERNAKVAYGMELDGLREGNFGKTVHELAYETQGLRARQQYVRRGAQALFTLTLDGRP